MPTELIEYLKKFRIHTFGMNVNGDVEIQYGNEKITIIVINYVLVPNYADVNKLIKLLGEYELIR